MLALIGGVLLIIGAVLEWVNHDTALVLAMAGGAFLCFHFAVGYWYPRYRRQ